ncbi:MAG: hypothetical protein ACI8Y7_000954 [Candidatus Woesearchaeota archaeon]|jgi:hypothetical protein
MYFLDTSVIVGYLYAVQDFDYGITSDDLDPFVTHADAFFKFLGNNRSVVISKFTKRTELPNILTIIDLRFELLIDTLNQKTINYNKYDSRTKNWVHEITSKSRYVDKTSLANEFFEVQSDVENRLAYFQKTFVNEIFNDYDYPVRKLIERTAIHYPDSVIYATCLHYNATKNPPNLVFISCDNTLVETQISDISEDKLVPRITLVNFCQDNHLL